MAPRLAPRSAARSSRSWLAGADLGEAVGGAMLARGALVRRPAPGCARLCSICAPRVVAAAMAGEHLRAIDDAHLVRVGEHRQHPPHMGVRHGVVVQVEADIGRLADLDRDALEQRRGIVGQRQQARRLLGEHRAHRAVRFARTAPVGGQAAAPVVGLGIEVVEIGEAAGGEERRAHVADGALDAALLVAARHRDRTRFVAIVPGKVQQRGMEADRVAAPFQHRALEIVVEQNARHAAPGGEGADMAAQEVLHPGVEEEAQEDLPRVAQHHDERHQRTAGAADLQMAEVPPVDLRLFAGQAAQPQIRLRRAARPMLGNEVAEVIGAAAIAALAHHREQAAGGQGRELLQRLADQRQIGVDLRRPRRRADPGQPACASTRLHHAVVDVQLPGDGADRPLLGVIVAQDLRLDVRRRHHGVLGPVRSCPTRPR